MVLCHLVGKGRGHDQGHGKGQGHPKEGQGRVVEGHGQDLLEGIYF